MKTIFLSIASYRDAQCPVTVKNAYENAKHPERIFTGICQQNKQEDLECFDKHEKAIKPWKSQIRTIKLPHYEAKGPTWARYLCSKLWDGEDYYFQIDSHTKLVKDWDEKLISMVENIEGKAVISHYPPGIEDYDNPNPNPEVSRICKSFFNDRDMISFLGAEAQPTEGKCYEVPYVAAGMIFCHSSFLKDLPFDPTLDYLFVGEEILISARFWTNGWNIYTPSENIAYHFYTRKDEPKIWTDITYKDDEAFYKVQKVLKLKSGETEGNNYGLGTERTLEDYYEFAGIDLENKRVVKNFCRPGNIETDIEEIPVKSTWVSFSVFLVILILSGALGYYLKIRKY